MPDVTKSYGRFFDSIGALEILMFDKFHIFIDFVESYIVNSITICHPAICNCMLWQCVWHKSKLMLTFMVTPG